MTVRQMINKLENFALDYGDDVKVVANRNDRDYPVYIAASGAYPANTSDDSYSSGYFNYLDEDDEGIASEWEFNRWVEDGDTDYKSYEEYLEDNNLTVNLCVLND